jgi:receptor protein-tyrosine kinase
LRELTKERLDSLLRALRARYEFVIIDGSPILPVVDSRLIGQYVDGVLLSALRDVSQLPKMLAARAVLDAFDIPFLGVVLIGSTKEDVYYYDHRDKGQRLDLATSSAD